MAISREEIDKIYAQYGYVRGNPDKSQLTMEEIIAELKKLKDVKNHFGFLYFCLEYVNVSHPAHGSVPFATEMYEWQINAAQDFLKHTQIVSKKVRQVGFSTIVGAYALWRALFFESQNIGIVSLTQRDSVIFLERVKFVYDKLPIWLRQDVSEFAKTTVTFKHNHSKIVSLPNTKDPARGSSLSLLIVDEFADFDSQNDFLSAAVPALSVGLLIPFSDDKLPSQFFIISTLPKSPMTKEGENQYLRILHKAQESEDEFKLIEVTVRDIPHYQSEEWHKQMRATLNDRIYSIQVLGQEVYETENLVIPNYVLEKLKEVKPLRVDFLQPESVDEEGYFKNMAMMPFLKDGVDIEYGYIQGFWVWEDPDPELSYAVICDPATGRANDSSAIQVFCLETNEQVAEYKGKVDTERFKVIIEMITMYYNKAKLVIESTGLGAPICDYFAETLIYENFYWHQHSKNKFTSGFPMSTKNRAQAIAILQSVLVRDIPADAIKINSVRLMNELRIFGYTKTGRIEAIAGHDDLVMALAMYLWTQAQGFATSDKIFVDEGKEEVKTPAQIHQEEQMHYADIATEGADKYKRQIKKYFHDDFDIETSPQMEEMLRMMAVEGAGIPIQLLRND